MSFATSADDENPFDIGMGAHVMAGTDSSFAVTYTRGTQLPAVLIQRFDSSGRPLGAPLDVSVFGEPTTDTEPVVAALPDDRYVVAWSAGHLASPDILLAEVGSSGALMGDPFVAHVASAGPQAQPDVIWDGSSLVLVWSELDDVVYRTFDESLMPRAPEAALADTDAVESAPVLAPMSGSWAAAWRSDADGFETIHARWGNIEWRSLEAALPGPSGDRPALVQLDNDRLLALWSVGTEAEEKKIGSQLRLAILDVSEPGQVSSLPWGIRGVMEAGRDTRQLRPVGARVGSDVFIGWLESTPGESRVVVQQLATVGEPLEGSFVVRTLVLPASSTVATARPTLGSANDNLLMGWEQDLMSDPPARAWRGSRRPLPWLELNQ